jgi:SAM-dependent methyltransferase
MTGDRYTFGDDPAASARLALLAELFEPTTRALLAPLEDDARTRVVDLGCGPGHTTALLAERFPAAEVVGLDRSPTFLAEARAAGRPRCRFLEADVTEAPLPGTPADVIYARYLLSHLPSPTTVLAGWAGQLAPGGVLVVEEAEAVVTDDDLVRRYLAIVEDLVASEDGTLFAGPRLTRVATGPEVARRTDQVAPLDLPADRVAEMFWLNSQAWGRHPHIVEHHDAAEIAGLRDELDRRRRAGGTDTVRWEIRQIVVARHD